MNRSSPSGFSLVEILIVVVVLGIVAAVVMPQFAGSSEFARYTSTIDNLQDMREIIDLYKNKHRGRLPGVAGADPDLVFVEQMSLPTNVNGERSGNANQGFGDPDYPLGPYVPHGIPANPFNGSRAIRTVTTFPASPPGGSNVTDPGWIYEITSGRIRINNGGPTPFGTEYWEL